MAGAVWLSLRMRCGLEALAEVIAAAALVNQTEIPRTDGQLTFSFALQQRDQLCHEIREDVTDKGTALLHDRGVAGYGTTTGPAVEHQPGAGTSGGMVFGFASKSYSRTYEAASSVISLTSTGRPWSVNAVREMRMTGVPVAMLN